MKKVFKVISDWKDDLIWHPSQCFKEIEYNGRQFVIYLRWRWNDPWTCQLIECNPDFKFDMQTDFEWIDIDVDFFTDKELELLKVNAEQLVNKWFLENENNSRKLR